VSTLNSCVLGTMSAFAVQRYRFFGRSFFRVAVAVPLLLPGVVTGIALLVYFRMIGIRQGMTAVMIGHITFCFPVVFNTIAARVARLPRSLEEAAADLGANFIQRWTRVVFPSIFSAMLSGGLLAFTLSLDEIVVTYFLASGSTTLPVAIYTGLRTGFKPDNLAIVTCIIAVSGLLILLSQWLVRERR
jgi:spermidine/putrescine transport system permease protein